MAHLIDFPVVGKFCHDESYGHVPPALTFVLGSLFLGWVAAQASRRPFVIRRHVLCDCLRTHSSGLVLRVFLKVSPVRQ